MEDKTPDELLDDFHFLIQVGGAYCLGPSDVTAMVAEGWWQFAGKEVWDRTADDLATMRLMDKGKVLPTPWWWALPGVTDLILRFGKVVPS